MTHLVFDVGMYDASDTAYYLELGYRVVAVEANPDLVARAEARFSHALTEGRLILVPRAISDAEGTTTLHLGVRDLGDSSIADEWIGETPTVGTIAVPTARLADLIAEYGVPYYLKVDIEGSDHLCVRALTTDTRPAFLSFEAGKDMDALLGHAESIGYTRFKAINQVTFRALGRERQVRDRLSERIVRWLGYAESRQIRRAGRFFVAGHSSGPVPWVSDGPWVDAATLRRQWATRAMDCWYDVQATTAPSSTMLTARLSAAAP